MHRALQRAALLPGLALLTIPEHKTTGEKDKCTDEDLNHNVSFFEQTQTNKKRIAKSTQGFVYSFEIDESYYAEKSVKVDSRDYEAFENEIRILKHLQEKSLHDHIITLVASQCGVRDETIGMVTPLAIGNMTMPRFLPNLESFKQVLEGLEFLKGRLVVHRDIKPQNILVYPGRHLRIADFGIAVRLNNPAEMLIDQVGVPMYMSPARVGGRMYSFPSDLWSLGVIIAQFVRYRRYDKLPCLPREHNCLPKNFNLYHNYIQQNLKHTIHEIRRTSTKMRPLMDLAWECVSAEPPERAQTPMSMEPETKVPPPTPEKK